VVFLFVGSSASASGLLPTKASRLRSCLGLVLGSCCLRYERQPDCIPALGTFTPSVHAHVMRMRAAWSGRGMERLVCIWKPLARARSLGALTSCMFPARA